MLFVAGFEKMSTDELRGLVAQLEATRGLSIFVESLLRVGKRFKEFSVSGVSRVLGGRSKKLREFLRNIDERLDWDPELVVRKIEEKMKELETADRDALLRALRGKMMEIGGVKDPDIDMDAVASAVVHVAAGSMKMDGRLYPSVESLEKEIFRKLLVEVAEGIHERLAKLGADDYTELEKHLKEELGRLGEAEREAMRRALGVDELSAGSLLEFFKVTSGTAVVQMVLGGTGFGAFLCLSTMIKSLGLLVGVSFPFATYLAASSVLSFMLSWAFLPVVMLLSGGFAAFALDRNVKGRMAGMLVLVGRASLMKEER